MCPKNHPRYAPSPLHWSPCSFRQRCTHLLSNTVRPCINRLSALFPVLPAPDAIRQGQQDAQCRRDFALAFSDPKGPPKPGRADPWYRGSGGPTALRTFAIGRAAEQQLSRSLIYRRRSRTSVCFFGAYNKRTISNQPLGLESLLNTIGYASGLPYSYRLSDHAT